MSFSCTVPGNLVETKNARIITSAPFMRVCAPPLQDVVNVVGGLGVLLPLLEQVCEAEPVCNGSQEISDLLGPELTSSRGPAAMLLPLNKSSGNAMSALFSQYLF